MKTKLTNDAIIWIREDGVQMITITLKGLMKELVLLNNEKTKRKLQIKPKQRRS